MAKIPGQTSTISLLISSFWTISALIILIVGHLVWVFMIYGILTHTDTLKELDTFLPMLSHLHMHILAGLALIMDIWIFVSHRKERTKHLQHRRSNHQ